jgi:hypothetical protein
MESISNEIKTSYTPAQKKAILTYREKNKENYNDYERKYYHLRKTDDEWRKAFNERCKIANRKRRENLKNTDEPKRGRGRPKKNV